MRHRRLLLVGCSLQDPHLDWLAGLPDDWEQSLKPWRAALMTASEWQRAIESRWQGGHASGALCRGNVRPVVLENHDQLGVLLATVAQRLDAQKAGHGSRRERGQPHTPPRSTGSSHGSKTEEPVPILVGPHPFHVFGTIPDNHASYIRRRSDGELKVALNTYPFVALVGQFQYGKSSLSRSVISLQDSWIVLKPNLEFCQQLLNDLQQRSV